MQRLLPAGQKSFTYEYNAASQVSGYTGPEGSLTYAYDNSGQLTGVSGARTETYSFDANGNRNMTGYVTAASNEMTADAAGNTFSYLCSWQPQPVRIFRIFSVTKSLGESLRYGRGACPFGEARERVRAGGAMGESGCRPGRPTRFAPP